MTTVENVTNTGISVYPFPVMRGYDDACLSVIVSLNITNLNNVKTLLYKHNPGEDMK